MDFTPSNNHLATNRMAFSQNNITLLRRTVWILAFLMPVFYIFDALSTRYIVLVEKIAQEANPLTLFLWNHFGWTGGETLRFAIFLFCWYILLVNMQKAVGKKREKTLLLIVLFPIVLYAIVIVYEILLMSGIL